MECTFVVGQKVACVREEFTDVYRRHGMAHPIKGCVYTVSVVTICDAFKVPALIFEELPSKHPDWPKATFCHRASNFRPCKDTDISDLVRLTQTTPKELEVA